MYPKYPKAQTNISNNPNSRTYIPNNLNPKTYIQSSTKPKTYIPGNPMPKLISKIWVRMASWDVCAHPSQTPRRGLQPPLPPAPPCSS